MAEPKEYSQFLEFDIYVEERPVILSEQFLVAFVSAFFCLLNGFCLRYGRRAIFD